ncbi:MAG: sporulation integral membrane protein YlbJ [Bacillota bacterium]|nr:sporulation integral membrane protein YlbJ [Bacillota bacterium]
MFAISLIVFLLFVFVYIKTGRSIFTSTAKGRVFLLFTSSAVTFFVLSLIAYPEACYRAAVEGVDTWFNVVLPALLPFFVGAELMIGLGIIDLMGTMLEPFMRPVFRTPGLSSFALIMSMTSGYPVGVKLTCRLRQQNKCTRVEGQRMLAFCSTSGPLFMIGAVAVGMLGNSKAGIIIAVSHYTASIILGIIFSRILKDYGYCRNTGYRFPSLKDSIGAMYRRRLEDGRPVGVLLGDAVRESIDTLLMVGGFIIIFSVVIEVCAITGLLDFLSEPVSSLLMRAALPAAIVKPILSGILEITTGSRMIASLASVPLIYKVLSVSFIIGWSGFSIHAQSISFISKTDLSPLVYLVTKLLHGFFALILSTVFYKLFIAEPVQQVYLPGPSTLPALTFSKTLLASSGILLTTVLGILAFLLLIKLLYFLRRR